MSRRLYSQLITIFWKDCFFLVLFISCKCENRCLQVLQNEKVDSLFSKYCLVGSSALKTRAQNLQIIKLCIIRLCLPVLKWKSNDSRAFQTSRLWQVTGLLGLATTPEDPRCIPNPKTAVSSNIYSIFEM
jgi:hypothetical protein